MGTSEATGRCDKMRVGPVRVGPVDICPVEVGSDTRRISARGLARSGCFKEAGRDCRVSRQRSNWVGGTGGGAIAD